MLFLSDGQTRRIYDTWANWKIALSARGGGVQYGTDNAETVYQIWFYDGSEIHLYDKIWLVAVPQAIVEKGYTQSQNDADKADFETNYLPTANRIIVGRTTISDGVNSVSIKPPSTAPTAADSPLVVILHPNQQSIPVSSAPALANPGLASGRVVLGGSTSGTLQAIRATPYNEPSSGAQRSFASSSPTDAAAGTGAHKVTFTYFTDTGAGPYTETVTLNGTTPVPTVATNIRFIENMKVSEVGSGGVNAAAITMYVNNSGGGGTIGTIGVGNLIAAVGDNQTFWAHHYVPATKTASFATFIVSAFSGGSGTQASFVLKSINPLTANAAETIFSDILVTSAEFARTLGIQLKVSGFGRVTAYGIPGVNNATLAASFDFAEL